MYIDWFADVTYQPIYHSHRLFFLLALMSLPFICI